MIIPIETHDKFFNINLMDVTYLIACITTENRLKVLTSIDDETWHQYTRMVENNQQFSNLIMKLVYK